MLGWWSQVREFFWVGALGFGTGSDGDGRIGLPLGEEQLASADAHRRYGHSGGNLLLDAGMSP